MEKDMDVCTEQTSEKPDLFERLRKVNPLVEEIRTQCRVSSISAGIVHEGAVLHTYSTGMSNREYGKQSDADTMYMLCSISKLFVPASVGILVDEGKLKWDDPVSKYLPGFTTAKYPKIGKQATFVDVLRHSAGLSNPVVSVIGPFGKVLLPEENFLEAVDDAPMEKHLQETGQYTWEYSNIGYGIIAMAVQRVSGVRYSAFLKERVLEPLGMHNTAVDEKQVLESTNVADPYVQLENGTWQSLKWEWTSASNTPVLACFGMRSSINDLLIFCAAVMAAEQRDTEASPHKVKLLKNIAYNPLKGMREIRDGAFWTRPHDDPYQTTSQFYLGWMKAVIPSCQLGWGSWNEKTFYDDAQTAFEYILGRDSGDRKIEILKHTGLGIGSAVSINTFPQSHSSVVVLCNGLNIGDAADFTAQVYIQALFDLSPHKDIMPLVKLETERRLQEFYLEIMRGWLENRKTNDPESPLDQYVGHYRGLGITVSVRLDHDTRKLNVELNRKDVCMTLEFYGKDMYSYMPTTRDDWLRDGWLDWDYYTVGILAFTRDYDDKVDGFTWKWDELATPSKFTRMPHSLSSQGVAETPIVQDKSLDRSQQSKCSSNGDLMNGSKQEDDGQSKGALTPQSEEHNQMQAEVRQGGLCTRGKRK
ncbi:MAG: hypothetical protein M1821_001766 [Bathelium mastoideum]|nr:MAG: hypothetical protein M1821_001766 [Bathelium mastoideum]